METKRERWHEQREWEGLLLTDRLELLQVVEMTVMMLEQMV
jgi:hypothetical protein